MSEWPSDNPADYRECYACMVGLWTGPESHSEVCPRRNKVTTRRRHVVRTGVVAGRDSWECSCGRSGSVGEWGDVDIASDAHIVADGGARVDSSASFDDPWPEAS